jgi:hypothetical protein
MSGFAAARVLFSVLVVLALAPQQSWSQVVRKTVGPDGTYDTIQTAVNDCAAGVECQVDVQGAFLLAENILFPSSITSGSITVTGGWDSTFAYLIGGPESTTVDGGAGGRVIDIRIGGGTVTIENLTIENGADFNGAGVQVLPFGTTDAAVELTDLRIRNNHASATYSSYGGGVWAELDGTERLEINRCEITSNSATVTSGTGAVVGGGLMIAVSGSASFLVEDSWAEENTIASDTARKQGSGQSFSLIGDSSGEVIDFRVTNNTASGTNAQVTGSGGFIGLWDNAAITVRQSAWALNSDLTAGSSEQSRVVCYGGSSLLITDTGVVLGDQDGLDVYATDTAEARLVNLSVADNTLTGMRFSAAGSATASLYNTISHGNGTDTQIDASVATGSNLVGVDPLFMSPGPPDFNYRLDAGSPGLDAGTNAPPGGLGPVDLDGRPRIENGTVDIGCYEGAGLIFLEDFESGGTGDWSDTVP